MNRLSAGVSFAAIIACTGLPFGSLAQAADFAVASGTETAPQTLTGTDHGSVAAGAALAVDGDDAITWTGTSDAPGAVIDNAGTISSASDRGIDTDGASGFFTLNNQAGALLPADNDAFRVDDDAADTVVVNNSGTITSAGGQALDFGSLESRDASVTIVNTVTGVIRAEDNDAICPGSGTILIDNAGLIDATGGTDRGINQESYTDVASFTLVNREGGTIQATGDTIRIEPDGGADTDGATGKFLIDNSGTIASTGTGDDNGQAIDFDKIVSPNITPTIINCATGVIAPADADAIRPGMNGHVQNYGRIYGGGATDTNDGVDFQGNSGGVVDNYAGGEIVGTRHGITGDDPVTVTNAGEITGLAGSGINIDNGITDPGNDEAVIASNGTAVVTNTGTITGTATEGQDGDGIDADGLLTLDNYGIVRAVGSNSTDLNEGLAIGGGTITNHPGAVISGTGRAITVDNSDLGPAIGATVITNAGSIVGGTAGAIRITGTYANTLANTGAITGDVDLGGGDDTFNAFTGSSIAGTIDGGDGADTVDLDGSGSGSLSDVAGFESLNVLGGVWTVADSEAYASGATIASGATLVDDGALASTVTVQSGGTLAGTGSLAGLDAAGTVSPGDAARDTAPLAVTGDATIRSGSTYAVDLAGNGDSDVIAVGGTATIEGGTVEVDAQPDALADPSLSYTILSATGGVSGTFDSLDAVVDYSFLVPTLTYQPNAVLLGLARNGVAFTDVAQTFNQRQVAGAIETGGIGTELFQAVLTQNADGARQAFDALSGEIYGGLSSAIIQQQRLTTGLLLERLRNLQQGSNTAGTAPLAYGEEPYRRPVHHRLGPADRDAWRVQVWGTGYGDWTSFDGDTGVAKLDSDTGGFLVGLDTAVGGWSVGLAGGYANANLDARSSSADVDSYQVAVYGGRRFGHLAVNLGGSYAWQNIDVDRAILFPGFSGATSTSFDAETGQLFGEIGDEMSYEGIAAEPFAASPGRIFPSTASA